MQLIDERAISRGMVKVESGEDLVESLQALASAAGWVDAMVSGAGSLELVEILTAAGQTETLEEAELLSLCGRIHVGPEGKSMVTLRASVMAAGAVHVGRITAAMTGGLLLVVDAVSDAGKARSTPPQRVAATTTPSPASAPPPAASPAPAVVPPPAPASPYGDGQRSASKPLSQSFKTKPVVRPIARGPMLDDDEDENPIVNVGEFLNHPQLGLCEIVGEDASGGTKIELPSGKTRVLRLEALQVLPATEDEEGRKVYRIAGPRKR